MKTPDTRLIEAAFPLEQVSLDPGHEKNVRHGHISTLHIWPARRPLAASRAGLLATLYYPRLLAGETRPLPAFALDDRGFVEEFLKAHAPYPLIVPAVPPPSFPRSSRGQAPRKRGIHALWERRAPWERGGPARSEPTGPGPRARGIG